MFGHTISLTAGDRLFYRAELADGLMFVRMSFISKAREGQAWVVPNYHITGNVIMSIGRIALNPVLGEPGLE